jgi:hypothetical protein
MPKLLALLFSEACALPRGLRPFLSFELSPAHELTSFAVELFAFGFSESGTLPGESRAFPGFDLGLSHELAGLAPELVALGIGQSRSLRGLAGQLSGFRLERASLLTSPNLGFQSFPVCCTLALTRFLSGPFTLISARFDGFRLIALRWRFGWGGRDFGRGRCRRGRL